MVMAVIVGVAPMTMTQVQYCLANWYVWLLAPSRVSRGCMKIAVMTAKNKPMKTENQILKEAMRRALPGSFAPKRRAIRVPPPVPAMLATAMQTLKMGRMSAAPATI